MALQTGSGPVKGDSGLFSFPLRGNLSHGDSPIQGIPPSSELREISIHSFRPRKIHPFPSTKDQTFRRLGPAPRFFLCFLGTAPYVPFIEGKVDLLAALLRLLGVAQGNRLADKPVHPRGVGQKLGGTIIVITGILARGKTFRPFAALFQSAVFSVSGLSSGTGTFRF